LPVIPHYSTAFADPPSAAIIPCFIIHSSSSMPLLLLLLLLAFSPAAFQCCWPCPVPAVDQCPHVQLATWRLTHQQGAVVQAHARSGPAAAAVAAAALINMVWRQQQQQQQQQRESRTSRSSR
jgi:hypothetical protein